jgi:hypothetical protein
MRLMLLSRAAKGQSKVSRDVTPSGGKRDVLTVDRCKSRTILSVSKYVSVSRAIMLIFAGIVLKKHIDASGFFC